MRHPRTATAAICLGVLLLVDVLRVWLPAIITIFGQAASTPAELMGAFALCWFLLPLAAPALIRTVGARKVALAGALGLAVARLSLTAAPGGQFQLYLAGVGLLAGLIWLAATATCTVRPLPGLVAGLALGALMQTALGTYDLVWRGDWLAWTLSAVLAVLLVAAQAVTPQTSSPGGARVWWMVGPVLLLAGMVALSPALAGTAVSYLAGEAGTARSVPLHQLPQGLVCGAAVGLFALAAAGLRGRGLRGTGPRGAELHGTGPRGNGLWSGIGRWAVVAAPVVGTVLFALDRPAVLLPAILLTAFGLGGCLRLAATPVRQPVTAVGAAYAAVGGMLAFAVGAIVYYAAYDLGYPNGWVPVAVALAVALIASRGAVDAGRAPVRDTGRVVDAGRSPVRDTGRAAARTGVPGLRSAAVLAVGTLLAAVTTAPAAPAATRPADADAVRLVAYNIRMGFGLDGRFDLTGLVNVIAGQRPDVVVLSEVDRGWLLNGGHDTLELLAGRLRLPYVFAPAADAVWGDAVLTRFPVRDARTLALPAVGAPTGAQALAVTLAVADREMVVVATHLQPPPDAGPVLQARAVARFATEYAADRPLVVAGDLNTEPGEPAFAEFTSAGLVDALATGRPLATSPADAPDAQIDHVFVSSGLRCGDVAAPRSTASDHLPVAVTVTVTS